ncbi:MAG: 30S ribosomal protein S12 methylthiotransferase RimO [Myxococcales bacterium]|nr:30S ribosomal protein S12 methylthiotransferase RimO [Myxococcales bacterium]
MSTEVRKVHFLSLGCPKNRIDTETMLASLPGARYTMTPEADEADVVVVNTCAFVESAKKESVDAILDMARLKEKGRIGQLVVTGCLAQRYPDELARELPEVDHFVGTNDLGLVTEILDGRTQSRVLVGNPDRRDFDWEAPRYNSVEGGHSAWLKIAEGCSNTCAFCIIPTLRGPQRSRSIESILREARMLAAQGVVELNLVAQDLTAYGYDLTPRLNLTALLEPLAQVDGIRWIRLLYAYPRSFPKGLVDLMASEPRIVPYLDMPLQHISDPVLKLMKRGSTSDTIRRRVAELREKVPGLVLRTTFISGFPGETDADHRQLVDFVQEARFERLGVFAYSREEGTPAHDLPNQVSAAVKARRLDEIMYVQRDISRAHNEALMDREVDVLVERPSAESDLVMVGRTAQQAPEIDGVTYIGLSDAVRPGAIVRAVVTQVTDYDLAVEPLE